MPFYDRAAWQRARRQALHDADYRCTEPRCGASLIGVPYFAHVHHRKPRARAPSLELEPLNLRAVCASCHNRIEPRNGAMPKTTSNDDGSPIESHHPWNAGFVLVE